MENGEEEEVDGLALLAAMDAQEDDDDEKEEEEEEEEEINVMQSCRTDDTKCTDGVKHADGVGKELEKQEKRVRAKKEVDESGGAFRFGATTGGERKRERDGTHGEGVETVSQLKIVKSCVPLVVIAERFRKDTGDFVFVNVARLETAMQTVQDRRWATIAVLADRSRIFESGGSSSMSVKRDGKSGIDSTTKGGGGGGGESASTNHGNDFNGNGSGNKYMVWTLTDLAGARTAIFLFGDAYATHWKMEVGSVVMVSNLNTMKRKNAAKTGRESSATFSVDKSQQVQKIGTSADFEICRGTKQDGSRCTMAVHRRDGYCQYHAAQGLRQLRQKVLSGTRMEFSSGNLASAMRPKGKNGNFLRDALLARKRPVTGPKKANATAAQLRAISAIAQSGGRVDAKASTTGGSVGAVGAESRGSRFLTSVADVVEQRTTPAGAAAMPSTTNTHHTATRGGGSSGCRSYVPAVSLRKVDTKQMTYNGGKMLDALSAPVGTRRPGESNNGALRGGPAAATTTATAAAGGVGRTVRMAVPVSGTQNIKRRREEQEKIVCSKTGGVMWMPRAPRPPAAPSPPVSMANGMIELTAIPGTAVGAHVSDPAIAKLLEAIKAKGKPNPNIGTEKRAQSTTVNPTTTPETTVAPQGSNRTITDRRRQQVPESTAAPSSRRTRSAAPPAAMEASGAPGTSTHTAFAAAFGGILRESTNNGVRDRGADTSAIDTQKSKYDAVVLPANEKKLMDALDVLRQQEDLAEKLDAVREIKVRVHTCLTCSVTSEKPLTICANKGHSILSAKGVKRFFSCRACKTRTTTLNMRYPKKTCLKCGADVFDAVGMSSGPKLRDGCADDELLPRGEEHAFSLKQDL